MNYSENQHDGNLVDGFEVDQTWVLDLVSPLISLMYNEGIFIYRISHNHLKTMS